MLLSVTSFDEPHAASVAAVQAGVPLVVVVTGAPDAVCVPLVQV
jgi:antitoxin (DNA-binding transcriptional repressor) of toxin-antitoxin stability system